MIFFPSSCNNPYYFIKGTHQDGYLKALREEPARESFVPRQLNGILSHRYEATPAFKPLTHAQRSSTCIE